MADKWMATACLLMVSVLVGNLLAAATGAETPVIAIQPDDRPVSPPPSQTVPLTISRSDSNSIAWFINTGVPFPFGKLTDECGVRLLTPSGRELPVQTEVRARWRKDGPIKWLGLIFEAPADADKVELEYGTEVKPGVISNAIQVKESEGAYIIDTGAAKFEVLKAGFNGINRIWRNDHWRRGDLTPSLRPEVRPSPQKKEEFQLVGCQEAGDGPYLVNQKDERFVVSADPEVRVTVERKGALSVTLHAEGWFIKEGVKGLSAGDSGGRAGLIPAIAESGVTGSAQGVADVQPKAGPPLAEKSALRQNTDASQGKIDPAERLCRHSTRLTFYAGRPDAEIDQAVIITYDTRETRLRDIGWSQRLDKLGGQLQTSFGRQAEPALARPWNGRESLRLVQSRADKFTIETDKEELTRGKRSAGWLAVSGQSAGMQATVRDLWELFPKELEAVNQRLLVHIWPAHGKQETPVYGRVGSETNAVQREVANALSTNAAEAAKQGLMADLTHKEIGHLWFSHTGRELDFRFPPAYRHMLDRPKYLSSHESENEYKDCAMISNGQGVGIYTEWLLHITDQRPTDAALEAGAAAFQDEPSACATPAWMCAADTIEQFLPVDLNGPFGRLDWKNIYTFAASLAAQDAVGDYGMFNYRDFHADNSYWCGMNDGWNLNRLWNAGHHSVPRIPWIYYMRTGDARWLKLGERNVRHLANVDVIHYAVPGEKLVGPHVNGENAYGHTAGAMYHCKGFVHWGGDSEILAHLISFDPMLYSYYLTGDLRSQEVFREWTSAVKRVTLSRPNVGSGTREGAQSLEQLVAAYEQEWDPVLLKAIQGYARAILSQPAIRQGWMTYSTYYLVRYYRLTHDPAVKPWLMQWVDDVSKDANMAPHVPVLTVAGRLFGDAHLLKLAAEKSSNQQALIPDAWLALDPWSRAAEDMMSGKTKPEVYYANAYQMHERSLLFRALADAHMDFLPNKSAGASHAAGR